MSLRYKFSEKKTQHLFISCFSFSRAPKSSIHLKQFSPEKNLQRISRESILSVIRVIRVIYT